MDRSKAVGGKADFGSREFSIDTLRGIAVILMVSGHVIGTSSLDGMQVSSDSGWHIHYLLLSDIRMPLFAAISGLVYAMRPISSGAQFAQFARGKFRRLVIPLVTIGTAIVLIRSLRAGDEGAVVVSGLWNAYLFTTGHLWFLESLFFILMLIGALDLFRILSTRSRLACLFLASAVVFIFVAPTEQWDLIAVRGALCLLPFFLLGYAFARYEKKTKLRWVFLGAAVVFGAVRAGEVFGAFALSPHAGSTVSLLFGTAALSALFSFREMMCWRPLARLGYFSFGIYLLHSFATALAGILLEGLRLDAAPLVFVVSLVVGVALPVVFQMSAGRVPWVSWAFLGQKPYRPRRATRPRARSDAPA